MKLNRESQTSVRKTDRERNISTHKAHPIMDNIIEFKPYMMYCTQ